jgi:formate C-acetyltransferase
MSLRIRQESARSTSVNAVLQPRQDAGEPHSEQLPLGRADQYLYDYFMNDLKNGIPLEKLSSMLTDLIGRWGTQTFIASSTQKESHQINFGINNVMLGGLDKNHEDCTNELSYLILHLVAQLQLSSPTVGLRWNKKTPDWIMKKGHTHKPFNQGRHTAI